VYGFAEWYTTYLACGIGSMESPTIIYEDNAACVVQMETSYVKSNINKHMTPKLFFPHDLQKNGDTNILQIKSCDNLDDLFTKSLPYSSFHKYSIMGIGTRQLKDLQGSGECHSMTLNLLYHHFTLFSLYEFYHLSFSFKVFNEVININTKLHIMTILLILFSH
jgi:hypothetical protein